MVVCIELGFINILHNAQCHDLPECCYSSWGNIRWIKRQWHYEILPETDLTMLTQ